MKRLRYNISKIIISGLSILLTATTFAQSQIDKTSKNIVDSLLKEGIDTIIEVRVKNDLMRFNSTYIYYKNKEEFFYKYCAIKVNNSTSSVSNCNNNWQTIFHLISTQWDSIKTEKIYPDTIQLSDNSVRTTTPIKYDVYEIFTRTQNNSENIIIRKDYFLPTENKHFKKNILTRTFLVLTLIEKYNDEIDKNNNR